ncbi:unnamed protein product, partial [Prunus brigantina]
MGFYSSLRPVEEVVLTEFDSPFHESLRSVRAMENRFQRKFSHDNDPVSFVNKSLSGMGFESMGCEVRYAFKSWKAASPSSSHLSLCLFFKALKNGLHLSVDLERNRFRAVALSVRL